MEMKTIQNADDLERRGTNRPGRNAAAPTACDTAAPPVLEETRALGHINLGRLSSVQSALQLARDHSDPIKVRRWNIRH